MNDIQQRLHDNNPFASVSSPFPWENNNPDITQLNREVSEEIEQLIRQKRREPSIPLAGLILGEIGYGKTHMMMRILRRLRDNEQPAVFAAIKAFRNPKGAMQHILSEIFINLRLTHSKGRSQFDILADGIVSSYKECRLKDGFDDIPLRDMQKYLIRDLPRLDRNFLRCILLYLGTDDEFDRADILEWLCDGLDDETSERLGLPIKDTNSMTEERREELAEKTLISLGIVMGYAKIPMIVCFDQLDNMDSPELIKAWGEVVSLLINDLPGVLPLCFLKAATWEDKFRSVLEPAVVQRLEHRKMKMKGCTSAQARKLVHEKIAVVFSNDTEEAYKWLMSRIENILRDGLSPREVVRLASEAITGTVSPPDAIKAVYNDETGKVKAAPLTWPPNADQLTLALEVWLSSIEGVGLHDSHGKYIRIQGVYGDRKFAFIIVVPKSHVTATNGVKEGLKFLNEYPGSYCCYVMEDKSHKKTWKKFAEKLNEFERAGGSVVHLDKDTRISWYALTALINRVDNGDVNIYTQASRITATRQVLLPFVSTLKLIDMPLFKLPAASVTYTPVSENAKPRKFYDEEILAKTMTSIVKSSPMSIMNIDKASELLAQRGISLSRNEVLSFVKKHRDRFRTFISKNDVLITVAEKS